MTRRGKHHKGDQPEMRLMMLWPHSQLQKAKAMAKQKTRVSPRRMAATVRLSCKRPPATPARGKGRGEHGAKSEEGGWTMVGPKPRSHTADFKLRAQDWDKPLLDARKFADKLEAASASDVLTGVLFCVTRRKLTSSRRWSPAALSSAPSLLLSCIPIAISVCLVWLGISSNLGVLRLAISLLKTRPEWCCSG